MIRKRIHKMTHMLKTVGRRISVSSGKRRRIIIKCAEKLGLVYFGTVDQYRDEHHIVRGLTVSSTHQDDNYSVGTFENYDISIVDRVDSTERPDGSLVSHSWLIIEIDLHTTFDLPHTFLGAHSHVEASYSHLFSALSTLQPVPLGTFEEYSPEFTKRYGIYTSPSHFIQAERLFDAGVARSIAAHFWPLAVEVYEGSIYVYADDKVLTSHLLDTMIQNGIWLATVIDSTANRI